MAVEKRTHRAVNVGLCAGLGVLAPLAAYAVSMPYDAVHEVVASGAAPFAVGAVVGVGSLAISNAVSDRRAEKPETAARKTEKKKKGDTTVGGETAVKGVPVIQRAPGAMGEEEAWAQIDALMDDDRISCDPEHAQDLYQIALDELSRTGGDRVQAAGSSAAGRSPDTTEAYVALAKDAPQRAQQQGTDSTAAYVALAHGSSRNDAADDGGARPSADPESTDVYLSLVKDSSTRGAGKAAHDRPHQKPAAAPAASSAPDSTETYVAIAMGGAAAARAQRIQSTETRGGRVDQPVDEESAGLDEDALCIAARDAAMESLYGPDVVTSAGATSGWGYVEPVQHIGSDVDTTDPNLSREEIWARAIAILEEDEEDVPRPHGAHFARSVTVSEVERAMEEQGINEPPSLQYAVAARMATAAPVPSASGGLAPGRVAAVAEGARQTAMHSRVNELIEEEFDKVDSQSVRHTSHEYLKVIQGGTASMPCVQEDERMQAEA